MRPPRRAWRALARHTVATTAVIAFVALAGCEVSGPLAADRLQWMTDEQVVDHLDANPESRETQYVDFMLSPEAGLRPPRGVTERSLLIFAYQECASPGSPPAPAEWHRERLGEPVGFENFVHTARGFAHRMICPSDDQGRLFAPLT